MTPTAVGGAMQSGYRKEWATRQAEEKKEEAARQSGDASSRGGDEAYWGHRQWSQ